jgi:raffinose/stachyose/melibiose transport system substrate-binding protein
MKKTIRGVLVLVLLLVSLVTFGQAKVTLSWWHEFTAGGEKAGMDDLIGAWNKANPNIQIEQRPIGNEDFFTVIRTGLAGNEPPDLLQWEGNQQTRDFAAAGQLTEIPDIWAKLKDKFDLFPIAESAVAYKGKIYGIPMAYHGGFQFYYNVKMLKDAGIAVPANFEDFLAACEKFKQKGIFPIALGARNGWPAMHWWMNFLAQRVGAQRVFDALWARNGVKFTDADFVQATDDFLNLKNKGYFSEGMTSDDFGTGQAAFYAQKSPFFQTGTWMAADMAKEPPAIEVGIAQFPRFKNAKNKTDVSGASLCTFGVPSRAAHKAEALKVLSWLGTREAFVIWAKDGNIALYKGVIAEVAPPSIKKLWATVYTNAKASVPWLEIESPPSVGEDKIYNGLVALLAGSLTRDKFLKDLQASIEEARK